MFLLNKMQSSKFFIDRSVCFNDIHFFYKFGHRGFCFRIPRFIKVRFLVGLLDVAALNNSLFVRSTVGLMKQMFFENPKFKGLRFGLRNELEHFSVFFVLGNTLSHFFLYSPEEFSDKWVLIGSLGSKFPYFRFLLPNAFTFFGFEYFKNFYLDYFDYSGAFGFDISYRITVRKPTFFNFFDNNTDNNFKILYIFKNINTFFKLT